MPKAPAKSKKAQAVTSAKASASAPIDAPEVPKSQPSTSSYPSASDVKLTGWREEQVQKAATSLIKFMGQQQEARNDLLQDDELLHLVISLKKMPLAKRSDKPVRLPLPYPLYSTESQTICLFVKDVDGEGHKAAKKKLATIEKNGGVTKVGLSADACTPCLEYQQHTRMHLQTHACTCNTRMHTRAPAHMHVHTHLHTHAHVL
jgi:hypothetical protein